jgi:hypothetical protein
MVFNVRIGQVFHTYQSIFFLSLLILIPSLLGLNIAAFKPIEIYKESTYKLITIIVCCFIMIRPGYGFYLNRFELYYLLFALYRIVAGLYHYPNKVGQVSEQLFFVLVYFAFKIYFLKNKGIPGSNYLFKIVLSTLIIHLAYGFYFLSQNNDVTHLFKPNQSIYGVVVASILVLVIPLYIEFRKGFVDKLFKQLDWLIVLIYISAIGFMISLQGRAAIIGYLCGLAYFLFCYFPQIRRYKICFLSGIIVLLVVAFFLKLDSSLGRILILTVSFKMFQSAWLFGIGIGQYKIQYNNFQSDYFSRNSIDNREALLADHNFYAFNDFFEILIENGVIGFLIGAIFMYFLIKQIKTINYHAVNNTVLIASIGTLICITTSSLFIYSLKIFSNQMLCIFALAVISCFSNSYQSIVKVPKIAPKMFVFLIGMPVLLFFIFLLHYKFQSNQALQYSRSGFRNKSLIVYREIEDSIVEEGEVLFQHAKELYNSNRLEEALAVLDRNLKVYSTIDLLKLKAKIEFELKRYEIAERNYLTAIYMVPNRMASRLQLLKFYMLRKDTAKALVWCNSILNMPIKVPSTLVDNMLKQTLEIKSSL